MCTDKHNRRIDDERTAHNGIDFELCICDCFDIIFFCHFIMWTWNIEPHRAKKPHSLDKSTSGNLNNNEKIWTVLYLTETIKVETTWDKTAWNKCERNVDWETILQKKKLIGTWENRVELHIVMRHWIPIDFDTSSCVLCTKIEL